MRRVAFGVVLGLVVLLSMGMTGVQARASMTPFTGTEIVTAFGPPERFWIAGETVHARGIPLETTFEAFDGEFLATNSVVANFDLDNPDPAVASGHAYGTFTLTATWGELSGTFEGRWTQKLTEGAVLLRYVGHGSGDFEGMKLMGTATGSVGVLMHEGTILSPHG